MIATSLVQLAPPGLAFQALTRFQPTQRTIPLRAREVRGLSLLSGDGAGWAWGRWASSVLPGVRRARPSPVVMKSASALPPGVEETSTLDVPLLEELEDLELQVKHKMEVSPSRSERQWGPPVFNLT
jgi:hypothetical protein